MNIPQLAADIASRIPEMARDCVTNNEALIQKMIEEASKQKQPKHNWIYNSPHMSRWMPKDVYLCHHCGCWTSNPGLYMDEACPGRGSEQ